MSADSSIPRVPTARVVELLTHLSSVANYELLPSERVLLRDLAGSLPELLADRERVNWLERGQLGFFYSVTSAEKFDGLAPNAAIVATTFNGRERFWPSLREAIDAARVPSLWADANG